MARPRRSAEVLRAEADRLATRHDAAPARAYAASVHQRLRDVLAEELRKVPRERRGTAEALAVDQLAREWYVRGGPRNRRVARAARAEFMAQAAEAREAEARREARARRAGLRP